MTPHREHPHRDFPHLVTLYPYGEHTETAFQKVPDPDLMGEEPFETRSVADEKPKVHPDVAEKLKVPPDVAEKVQ